MDAGGREDREHCDGEQRDDMHVPRVDVGAVTGEGRCYNEVLRSVARGQPSPCDTPIRDPPDTGVKSRLQSRYSGGDERRARFSNLPVV